MRPTTPVVSELTEPKVAHVPTLYKKRCEVSVGDNRGQSQSIETNEEPKLVFVYNNEQYGAKANIYNQSLQGELCSFDFWRKVGREESSQQDNAYTNNADAQT